MNILIKYPTRNRPDKFISTFLKYNHYLSNKNNVKFIITMDDDDSKMNCPRIKEFLSKQNNVKYYYGNSKTKIEAINANMDNEEFDMLILASDDMIPLQVGYDESMRSHLFGKFPDGDGVLQINDGRQGERLNTLCIMGKKYYDRFGYIYNPEYTSIYADNEFTDVSRLLNRVIYVDYTPVRHYWVSYTGIDELTIRNESKEYYRIDEEVYKRRKSNNFGLYNESSGNIL